MLDGFTFPTGTSRTALTPEGTKYSKRLINDVNTIREGGADTPRQFKPDFLVHTGDLAFSGKEREYIRATKFLHALVKAAGLRWDDVFIVPGNHDVDDSQAITIQGPGKTEDFDARSYQRFCDEYFLRSVGLDSLVRRFSGFTSSIEKVIRPHHRPTSAQPFFGCRIPLGPDVAIDIIGVASALLSRKDDEQEGRRLYLGRKQIEKAIAELGPVGRPTLRLALMHHPLDNLYPYDRRQCEDVLLRSAVDVVLRGHLHLPGSVRHTTPDGTLAILAAGSSYEKMWSVNGYNLYSYDLRTKMLTVWFRKWVPDLHCFRPNIEVYREAQLDGSIEIDLKAKSDTGEPKSRGKSTEPTEPNTGQLPTVAAGGRAHPSRFVPPSSKFNLGKLIGAVLISALVAYIIVAKPTPDLVALADYEKWSQPVFLVSRVRDVNSLAGWFTSSEPSETDGRDIGLVDSNDIHSMYSIRLSNNGNHRVSRVMVKIPKCFGVVVKDRAGTIKVYRTGTQS